jgi:transposase
MTAGCNKFLRIYYGRVKEFMNTLDEPVDMDSTGLSR